MRIYEFLKNIKGGYWYPQQDNDKCLEFGFKARCTEEFSHCMNKIQWFSKLKDCQSGPLEDEFVKDIQQTDIYWRDFNGNTGLAVAAARGLRRIIALLLRFGANPKTRNVFGTSVLGYAASYLIPAKETSNEVLHTQILTCIFCSTDLGAKMKPTDYDEYYTSEWLPK